MAICAKKHPLLLTTAEQLKKEKGSSSYYSYSYSNYSNGFYCKHCNGRKQNQSAWHCKDCKYDLCDSCHRDSKTLILRCPSNHALIPFYTNSSSFCCDECNSKQSNNTLLYGCRDCNYDVCLKCYDKRLKNLSSHSKKLEKIFNYYADKEDTDVMSESGMIKFFKDNNVNPESHHTLIIAYHLKSTEMGLIQKEEFCNTFSRAGIDDKKSIKKDIQNICQKIDNSDDNYKKFYRWIFTHAKEDEKRKTIPTDLAMQLLNIITVKQRPKLSLLNDWLAYMAKVKDTEYKAISKDVWEQSFDFLKQSKNIDSYDENDGWPVMIDEFVEWLKNGKK